MRRTLFIVGAIVLVSAGAIVGATVIFGRPTVGLEIAGPEQVTAGEPTVLTVRVVNRGSVALVGGTVNLTFPEGTAVGGDASIGFGPRRERLELGRVPAGGEFRREVAARFFGATGEVRRVAATLLYQPENVESEFTRQADARLRIIRVPVVVTVDSPPEISAGTSLIFRIAVDSETSVPLPSLTLGVDFPPGFELSSADPEPESGAKNRWAVSGLESGTSTAVTLRGVLRGDPQEVKTFRIRLGRYDAASGRWLILTQIAAGPTIASPLLLVQARLDDKRSGSLAPGSRLTGTVFFKNNLTAPVENIAIRVSFPERLVELASVESENGFYDVIGRAITWNPASEPRLAALDAGEEGVLGFSFTLLAAPSVRTFSDRNFTFLLSTTIESGTPPPEHRGAPLAHQDRVEFKLDSRLTLAARAVYYDSPVANTGPLPPRVRETTTYALTLEVGGGANDIRDVEVRAVVPSGVEFRSAVAADVGSVTHNPASRELTWRIGTLGAATGLLRPHVKAIIQLAFTPAENQVDAAPPLLRAIAASGRDAFSASDLRASVEDVTIELTSDPRTDGGHWRVVR